ncbi:sensor histidine kinase [candidate division KSB1 bacterium]
MDIQDKKYEKLLNFWVLHIAGWLIYFLLISANLVLHYLKVHRSQYGFFDINNLSEMFISILPVIIAFFVCILLRYFYKKIFSRYIPLLFLLIVVLITSVSSAVIIRIIFNFIYNNIWMSDGRILAQLYASDVFEMTMPVFGWSMLYFSIKYLQEWKKQKEKGEIADMLAQNAEFQILRYQLNPEFLFESLKSIRNIISEDKKLAKQLITNLSEFLRYSLLCRNKEEVPLKNELEAVKNYLIIENYRSGKNIIADFDISPEVEDYPVLCFLIHQLVEKLIGHTKPEKDKPKKLSIESGKINNNIQIEIKLTQNENSVLEKQSIEPELDEIIQKMGHNFTNRYTFELIENNNSLSIKLGIREKVNR